MAPIVKKLLLLFVSEHTFPESSSFQKEWNAVSNFTRPLQLMLKPLKYNVKLILLSVAYPTNFIDNSYSRMVNRHSCVSLHAICQTQSAKLLYRQLAIEVSAWFTACAYLKAY